MVVASLCEGYHWTLDQAFSITMPQLIMMNHASWVSRENMERKFDAKRAKEKNAPSPQEQAEIDRVNQLSPEELSRYMSSGWE